MRIRMAIPDRHVTPEVLEAALEATTLANEQMVRAGEVPPIESAIAKGLKWKPEPFTDGEHFDLATHLAKRGWGDCDDLAPWLAGEMRAHGIDAMPRVYKSGPDRWHVVVEDEDGRIHDPSRWAGMGRRAEGIIGMIAKPMAEDGDGALTVLPRGGKWWARADLPFPDAMGHIASHARANHPDTALDRAIAGAICCGAEIESPLTDRLGEVGELLLGDPYYVGSLFGGLKKLGKLAASAAIPGGGAAFSALHALSKGKGSKHAPGAHEHPSGGVSAPLHEQHGGDGGGGRPPGMIYFHPSGSAGPVIVRF